MRYVLLTALMVFGSFVKADRATLSEHSLKALTGLQDVARLNAHADSLGVPHKVMWAIAWQESRSGEKGNKVLGPGILVRTGSYRWIWNGHHTVQEWDTKRTCRELGRMQLNPCVKWTQVLHDTRCTNERLTASLDDNMHCAAKNMVRLAKEKKGWTYVPSWYNGGNPIYQQQAEQYLGHINLKELTS